MAIRYEWTLETLEGDDIVDSDFSDKLTWNRKELEGKDLGLVRNVGNEAHGVQDRSWAYVKDGKLPVYFSDSAGAEVAPVPEKYQVELSKYLSPIN